MKQLKLFATTSLVAFSLASFETTFAGLDDCNDLNSSTVHKRTTIKHSDNSSGDSSSTKRKKLPPTPEKYAELQKIALKNKKVAENRKGRINKLTERNNHLKAQLETDLIDKTKKLNQQIGFGTAIVVVTVGVYALYNMYYGTEPEPSWWRSLPYPIGRNYGE